MYLYGHAQVKAFPRGWRQAELLSEFGARQCSHCPSEAMAPNWPGAEGIMAVLGHCLRGKGGDLYLFQ